MNGGSEKSEDGGGGSSSPGGSSPAGSTSGSRAESRGGGSSGGGGCPACRSSLCSGSCLKSPSPISNSATMGGGILNYQRLASAVPSLVYHGGGGTNHNANSPYSPDQVAYLAAAAAAAAAEHSALYVAAGGGLPDMKDGGIGQSWGYPSMYHPYDPSFAAAAAAAAAAAYPFNGYAVDVNGSRRKNATRETTSTLKAWLAEHKKNPYPTKGEKIMLAIITKMTLTQVSTWFANARRRLKKENKMTWEPRNRPDDDDDVDISDSEPDKKQSDDQDSDRYRRGNSHAHGKSSPTGSSCSDGSKEGVTTPIPSQKPRIWSLADLAGSGNSGASESSHHNHSSSVLNHPLHPQNHHPSAAHRHLPPHHLHHPHHHSNSNLPGSAFSPLRSTHSEAVYRGLYPLPSHHPAVYHPDNP